MSVAPPITPTAPVTPGAPTTNRPAFKLPHRAKRKWKIPVLLGVIALADGSWWGWTALHPASSSSSGLITETLKLGDRLYHKPSELSEGQQRVAIAGELTAIV